MKITPTNIGVVVAGQQLLHQREHTVDERGPNAESKHQQQIVLVCNALLQSNLRSVMIIMCSLI